MLEQDSLKNEMETGAENSIITEWEMVDESYRMEPRTQLKIQDQQSDLGYQEKVGEDDINEFHKLVEDETDNFYWKQPANSKKHESMQQKTAVDGVYSKKNTQWLQKNDMKTMREWDEIIKADQRDTSTEWDWATKK